MVKLAKTRPLKFIVLILGLLIVYALSGTNLFTMRASGQGAAGAVEYIHIDAPTNVKLSEPFEVRLGVVDQKGNLISGLAYGQNYGEFRISPDGIQDKDGNVAHFTVDPTQVRELKNDKDQGTGIYVIPVKIDEWAEGGAEGPYILRVDYTGKGGGSADGATSQSYIISDRTTINPDTDGQPGVIKYSPVQIDKVALKVPVETPGQPAPPPAQNTVHFKVKLIGQAKDPAAGDTRRLSGRAAPENLHNWLTPTAYDNTGQTINVSYGTIKEEEIAFTSTRRDEKTFKTANYDVEVKVESPAQLAGRRAVIEFGILENGVTQKMSATVNFTSVDTEQSAAPNPFFANPYLVEIPHTPIVEEVGYVGVKQESPLILVNLADPDENPTNGYYIVDEAGDRVGIVKMRLKAIISDDAMISLDEAEFFEQDTAPDPSNYGNGTNLNGTFGSDYVECYYDYTSAQVAARAEQQYRFWVHGHNVTPEWGSCQSTKLSVDKTAPACAITDPVTGAWLRGTYYIKGTSNWNNGGGTYRAPVNSVQIDEDGDGSYEELAVPDGANFDNWTVDPAWDTTLLSDGAFALKARALDMAGNLSPDSVVNLTIDNTNPKANITSPTQGTGYDNNVTANVSINGSAYDLPIGLGGFDHYVAEWASGRKAYGDETGWSTTRMTFPPGHPGGANECNNELMATWNITGLSSGDYTLRITSYDKAGNKNLDRDYDPNINRIYVHIDTTNPTVTIDNPVNGWYDKYFTGTAADDISGVSKVEMLIQRQDNMQYWTGSTWQAGAPADWPDATITSGQGETSANWRYTSTASGIEGVNVIIQAKSYDDVTPTPHVSNTATSPTTPYDSVTPTSNVTPGPNGSNGWYYQTSPTLSLNATDATSGMNGGSVQYVWTTTSVTSPPSSGWTTLAYTTSPVQIQGPGAGPDGNGVYAIGGATVQDGRFNLHMRATDLATMQETSHYTTIKADASPPPIPSFFGESWQGSDYGESTYTHGTSNGAYGARVLDNNQDDSSCSYWVEYDSDILFSPALGNSGWTSQFYIGSPVNQWSFGASWGGLSNGQIYYYRVKSRDYAGNESTGWSGQTSTTMDNDPPELNRNAINPNQWYNTNQTVQLWVTDGEAGPRGFRWAWDSDPGNNWTAMSVWWGDTGSTSFPGSGKRRLYVWYYDNIYVYDHLNQYDNNTHRLNTYLEYWWDPYAPLFNEATFSYPATYDGWSTTQTPTVTIQARDDLRQADAISDLASGTAYYAYSTNGGGSWSGWTAAGMTPDGDPNTWETITASSVPFNQDSPNQNKIKFRVADAAGSIVYSSEFVVKIDSTPPMVSSTVPADDATPDSAPPLVAPNTPITATFNDDMRSATITSSTFTLERWNGSGWVSVSPLQVTYDSGSKKATFVPPASLNESTKYRATVTTGAEDKAGNDLDQDPGSGGNQQKQWQFYVSSIRADIIWPTPNIDVYGTIPVHGDASGNDSKKYRLQYGSGTNPSSWTDITASDQDTPKTSGEWTQTDWSSGNYSSKSNVDVDTVAGQMRLSRTDASWYNNSWMARKKIVITNTTSSTLTNYQVKIPVTFATDMQNDFDDIRFTDDNKTTLIDYWRESYSTGVSAVFWVEVPSISASSTKTIYMYYANSSASTTSSVANTFVSNSIQLTTQANNGNDTWANPTDNHTEFDNMISYRGQYNFGIIGTPGTVDRVDHSTNPHGAGDRFVAQYKFLYVPPATGQYTIGTNSDEASEVLINTQDQDSAHNVVLSWYGNHTQGPNLTDHSANVSLTAGVPVWFEYREDEVTGSQLAQMGIYEPLDSMKVVNTTNFSGKLFARKYAASEPTVSVQDDNYFASSGELVSTVYDATSSTTWGAVSWIETLFANTDITVQLRSGPTSSPDGSWTSWCYPRSVQSGDLIPGALSPNRYIQYKVNLKGDGMKSPIVDTVNVFNNELGSWDTTAVSDGTYTIRLQVSVSDDSDPDVRWAPDNVLNATVVVNVKNDTNNDTPDSTIVSPTNGSYVKGTTTISGTATDAFPGIGKVEVRIQRSGDNWYWNGTGWQSGEIWVLTDSSGSENSTWTYTMTGFETGYTYIITSKATDKANKAETVIDSNNQITVNGDNVVPSASIYFPNTPPANKNYVSAPYISVDGTATDSNFKDFNIEWQKNGESIWNSINSGTSSPASPYSWFQTTNTDFTAGTHNNTRAWKAQGDGAMTLARALPLGEYPKQSTQDASFDAAGFLTSGAGVVATDTSYLYVKRWGGYEGPTQFTKIGTGYGGTTAGTNYGTLPAGIYENSMCAFYLNGYVYNGYAVYSGGNTYLERQNVSTGIIENVQITGGLLRRDTGANVSATTNEIMVTTDGTYVYTIGLTSPNWKVRVLNPATNFSQVSEFTASMSGFTAYTIGSVVADGLYIYPIELQNYTHGTYGAGWWPSDSSRVTRIGTGFNGTTGGDIVYNWYINGSQFMLGGQYDWINRKVWLGKMRGGTTIYRYNASDEFVTSGTYTSAVFDAGTSATWGNIVWSTSGTGTITVQTRSGPTKTPDSSWSAWATATTGSSIPSPSNEFIQYKVDLSSSGGTTTIWLADMRLYYTFPGPTPPDTTQQLGIWRIDSLADGQYRLRLTVNDNAGNSTVASSDPVYIDRTDPVSVLNALLNLDGKDTGYVAGSGVGLNGTASDANIDNWVVERKRDDEGSWTTINSGTTSKTAEALGPAWNTTGLDNANPYTIRVRTTDKAGNMTYATRVVYVDNTAPTVTLTIPANSATNVDPRTDVTAYFSDKMDGDSLNSPATNFQINGGAVTPREVTYVDQSASSYATFKPATPFSMNTSYAASLLTGTKNRAGIPLAAQYNWSFTTAKVEGAIYMPLENTHISGTYPVMGRADGSQFGEYKLEYQSGRHTADEGSGWTQIGSDQGTAVTSSKHTQTDWSGGAYAGTVPFGTESDPNNNKYRSKSSSVATNSGYSQLVSTLSTKWLAGAWTKRKPITINNSGSSQALTDYQVNVPVDYDMSMKSDYSDLRFTDTDGQTKLNYWIESTPDWGLVGATSASGGIYKQSRQYQDAATFSFNGTSVTWYATKGPSFGNAQVYTATDGVTFSLVGTYNLYNATTQYNQSIYTWSPGAGDHAIRIVVSNTSGAYVDIDRFLVSGSTTYQEDSTSIKYNCVQPKVWVKVPSIDAASNKTIYMYYGNQGASAEQNPDQTFDFFDDFNNGSTVDAGKWDTSAAQGFLQAGAKSQLKLVNTMGRLSSNTTFTYPIVISSKTNSAYRASDGVQTLGFFRSTSDAFGILCYPSTDYYRTDGSWVNMGSQVMANDTWYKTSIEAQTYYKLKYDITNITTNTSVRSEQLFNKVNSISGSGEKITLGERYDNSYNYEPCSMSWDYVYARKYTATTPTVSTGATDSFQVSGTLTSVVFDGGSGRDWKMITWTENVPRGANIRLRTRTGNTTNPDDGSWTAWGGSSSYSGGTLIPAGQSGNRYIQYQAVFYSNGATLLDVTLWHTPILNWDTTSLLDGLYTLRLSVTDTVDDWTDSHTQRKAVVMNVDNTAPTVSVTNPADGALVTNMITASGTASDSQSSIGKIEVSIDSGSLLVANGTSRVNEDVAGAVYSGTWSTSSGGVEPSDGTLKYASSSGNSVTYTFNGTSVNWISTRGPDRGKASVTVDSDPAVDVDLYNADLLYQQLVFSKAGLTSGSHTMTISVSGTSNTSSNGTRVDIDGFDVGGTIDWTYDWVTNALSDSSHTFKVYAFDRAGKSASSTTRTVNTDNTDPVTAITAPAPNSAFTSDATVNGTASDINFDRYILQYCVGLNLDDTTDIGTYTPAAPGVSGGFLGMWPAREKTPLYSFNVDGDPETWMPQQQTTNIAVTNGAFHGRSTGTDSYLKTPDSISINANDVKVFKLRMKVSNAGGNARLYWKYSYPLYGSYAAIGMGSIGSYYSWNGQIPAGQLPLGERKDNVSTGENYTKENEWGVPQGSGSTVWGNDSRRSIKWPLQSAGQYVDYKIDMNTGRVWDAMRKEGPTSTIGTWINDNQTYYSEGSAIYSVTQDDTATLNFTGESVTFLTTKGPNLGIAKIYIDGSPITDGDTALTGDTGSNKSGIDLYAANTVGAKRVYTKTGLTTGAHTMTIQVSGQKNASSSSTRIDVDAFEPERLIVDYSSGSTGWPNQGFWAGTVYQIRIDPTENSGVDFDVDYLSELKADGNYTIRVKAYDDVNRSSQAIVYPVLIDRFAPSCYITSPVNMTFMGSGSFTATGSSVDDTVNGVASGIQKVQVRTIYNVDGFAPTYGPWEDATGTTSWSKNMNLPAGWHGIQAKAIDNAGNEQASNYCYLTVDSDDPPVPRVRARVDKNRGGITLSWTPVKDSGSGVDYYVIYRNGTPITDDAGPNRLEYPDGASIVDAEPSTTTKDFGSGNETFRKFHACNAVDKNFTSNSTMRYYVRAVDQVGRYSTKASITAVYDTQPPTTPSGLTASPVGAVNAANLAWTAVTDNVAVNEYRIYRDTNTGFVPTADKLIGTATVGGSYFTTKFYDSNLTWNTTYFYKVVAYDESLNPSTESNEATITTPAAQTEFSRFDQMEVFAKTGLGGGTHRLKIISRAAGYNVIDAFQGDFGTYEDDSPQITYNGPEWETIADANASGGTYRRNFTASNEAIVTFTGSQIKWISAKGPAFGMTEVWYAEDGVNYIKQTPDVDLNAGLPHVTYTSDASQCGVCHRAHSAGGEKMMAKQYEADTCFTCHDGTGSNMPTKAEFDYSPSGLHRVKDDVWPSGMLTCVDCHNPHLNTEQAFVDNFDDETAISDASPPSGWTYSATGGTWSGTMDVTLPGIDANHNEMRQSNTSGTHYAKRDTNTNLLRTGGYVATLVKLNSDGEAFISYASDGSDKNGIIASITRSGTNGTLTITDGTTSNSTPFTYDPAALYRIRLRLNVNRICRVNLFTVVKSDFPSGHDQVTDTEVARADLTPPNTSFLGSFMEIGTTDSSADFDGVKCNNPGMLMTRYRQFSRGGPVTEYSVVDDRITTEAFCLSCHGSSSDAPGGNQQQFYTSIHNPEMGGMKGQALDEDNTNYNKNGNSLQNLTPRWLTIRNRWKDIRDNPSYIMSNGKTIGSMLKQTNNACLYCHGYHGQQFYDRTQRGEEQLCFTCHGQVANYTRDNWNIYRQYNGFVEETSTSATYVGTWNTETGSQYGGGSVKYNIANINPAWYNGAWPKRKPITITNPGSALNNYQVKLTVSYVSDMKPDYSDLRFTDDNGTTALPFWQESYTSSTATVWVKVNINASSTKTIYMYYGNRSATSASDGASTFDFWDDFNGGTIDTAKWQGTFTGFSVTGSGELKGTNTSGRMQSTSTYSYPIVQQTKVRTVTSPSNGVMVGGFWTSTADSFGLLQQSGTDYYRNNGSWTSIGSGVIPDSNTPFKATFEARSSTALYYEVVNLNTGSVTVSGTPNNSVSNERITLGERYDNGNTGQVYENYWDYMLIRKYASQTLTINTGAETILPTCTYWFKATSVTVYSTKGPDRGTAKIYVDDVWQADVDLYNASFQYNTPIFTKTGLTANTKHTIIVMPVTGRTDIDAFQGGGSRHGLTMAETTIKCTSCHGQRAMTDRHTYEGYMTSIITNPNNIKQYWSEMRSQGKTFNDYCNACHKESDRRGRVLIETHTSSKIIPYTIKYPPLITMNTANGFDRTGYTLGDSYTYQENYGGITKVQPTDWLDEADPNYDGESASYSTTTNSYVEFTFTGSSITWTSKKDADRGIAQIFLDGNRIVDGDTQLPGDSGTNKSGIDLYNGLPMWRVAAYQKTGLDFTVSHTIKIIVSGEKNASSSGTRIDLDSFSFTIPRVGHYLFSATGTSCGQPSGGNTCHGYNTVVAEDVSSGSNTFKVSSQNGFVAGDTLRINSGLDTQEDITIGSLGGEGSPPYTITISGGGTLTYSHLTNETVLDETNCIVPDYVRLSQEGNKKITCVSCHHPHATDNERVVRFPEDYKDESGVVHKGICLHCHDGSVTK